MRWLLPLLAGCTFSPGTGFVTLTGGTLDARLEPGAARDLGDGWVLTDLGYEVRVDVAELALGDVRLEELRGAEAVDFDPADPPPGYSLCHAGHCHADDGRLVPYVEIEAELAGGSASLETLSALPVDDTVDLLSDTRVELAPTVSELPRGRVDRVAVELESVTLEGVVALDDGEVPLVLDLPWTAELTAGTDIPLDRDQPPVLALDVDLFVDGTLFDELELSELDLILDDPEDPTALSIVERLLQTAPLVQVREES